MCHFTYKQLYFGLEKQELIRMSKGTFWSASPAVPGCSGLGGCGGDKDRADMHSAAVEGHSGQNTNPTLSPGHIHNHHETAFRLAHV